MSILCRHLGERSYVCCGVIDDPWMGANICWYLGQEWNASDAQEFENGIYFTITIAGARSNNYTQERLIAPCRQQAEMLTLTLDMDIGSGETLGRLLFSFLDVNRNWMDLSRRKLFVFIVGRFRTLDLVVADSHGNPRHGVCSSAFCSHKYQNLLCFLLKVRIETS